MKINIVHFLEGEIDEKSNVQNLHIPNSDKHVVFYAYRCHSCSWISCEIYVLTFCMVAGSVSHDDAVKIKFIESMMLDLAQLPDDLTDVEI